MLIMMTTLEDIEKALQQQSHEIIREIDWFLFELAGDRAEEYGHYLLAETYRWMAANQRRPMATTFGNGNDETGEIGYTWFNEATQSGLNDKSSDIQLDLFFKLKGHHKNKLACNYYKDYRTYQKSIKALMCALKRQGVIK